MNFADAGHDGHPRRGDNLGAVTGREERRTLGVRIIVYYEVDKYRFCTNVFVKRVSFMRADNVGDGWRLRLVLPHFASVHDASISSSFSIIPAFHLL